MEFFGQTIDALDASMETPTPYGWFHLLWFAISITVAVVLCITHPKVGGERRVRRVVAGVAILVTLLEIYKQFNFTFSYADGAVTADYQWYAFPWQFCSMPMYVGLLTMVFRRGRIHRSLCAFLATYAMFAGLCVMFYPNAVFIDTIGINIQTMVCHGSMITVGIYLWYSGYVKAEHKTILHALPVFASAIGVAMILNEIAYGTGLLNSEDFNMFYISPHQEPHLPVYSWVQEVVPFPFCLLIYLIGFTLASYCILLAVMGIRAIAGRIGRSQNNLPSTEAPQND